MRVRIAASAPPMVIAGSTRCAKLPEPETGSQPSLMAKSKMRMGPRAKLGNGQAEQADHAEQAIVPAIAPLRRTHAGRNREQHRHQQRRQGQLQGVGITLGNQARDALVETQRWAKIAVQHAFPVVQILPAQRKIKAVGMAGGLHVGYGSAFSQHLKNGIAGHEVNQKEHERDDQPYHWQRVQDAEGKVSEHSDSCR